MKKSEGLLFLLFLVSSSLFSQQYNDFFINKACRVDFHFCGNAQQTAVFMDNVKLEPFWGGRHTQLDHDLNLGDYRFRVLDSISNRQIYINGFSSLYREWQSTAEALTTSKSFEQSIQFPFPKKAVTLIIEKRLDLDHWTELYRYVISPTDKLIQRTQPLSVPVKVIAHTASPDKAIDIAVIAEGYTLKEQKKFYHDARRLAENLLTHVK